MLLISTAAVCAQARTAQSQSEYIFLSLMSGTYSRDQTLSVEPVQPQITLRYSFRQTDGSEGPWIPFREPLSLTAAAGEEREYRLLVRADSEASELERRELQFRIDRRPPAAPRILPDPCVSWEPVTLQFEKSSSDAVYYALQGDAVRSWTAWDGTGITIGGRERRAEYIVQAYAVDPAGNRSTVTTTRYTVDTRAPTLDILSPVSGTFANAQCLALAFRNVQSVRYTLDGSDPAAGGLPYTGPVVIRRQGQTTVRVAAQPRAASRAVLRREATFSYAPAAGTGLLLDLESGSYPQAIAPRILAAPEGSLYYTLWEKPPAESDFLASSGIALPTHPGAPQAVTLRLRAMSDAGAWGAEYRYFFFIGQAGPTPPVITVNDKMPLRGSSRFQVTCSEDSLVAVTTDGSTPNPQAPSASVLRDLRPNAGASTQAVKAIAFNGSGVASALAEQKVEWVREPAAKPSLSIARGLQVGTAVVSASDNLAPFVYEITSDGAEPGVPTSGSPRLTVPLTLSVPFGVQRTFTVRAATCDEAGRIRAVCDPVSFTLKRLPPAQPLVTPRPGTFDEALQLAVDSPSTVRYTMTSDGSMPRDPGMDSTIAAKTIALPGIEGSLARYRVKLFAVDESGFATEVYGPFLYTVDLRPPRIPPIAGIAQGGMYNSRRVSPVLGESPWIVRYTVTSDGSAPPDPDGKSPQLTNESSFTGEEADVTTFTLKLLAISHNGKRAGEKREVSFVIDLRPPDVPRLSGAANGARSARPVTLSPEDAVPSDVTVFYSVSTGDADPADPVESGQALASPLVFDVPDGIQRSFVVRIATRDAAGNRSLYDRRYRFTIDHELPDDPQVGGIPPEGISERPVTLTMESREGTIVYEITDDGSLPRLPTAASSPYVSPLILTGRHGASVTYRLLGRAIDDLGNASRAARIVSVTVDRTTPPAPPQPLVVHPPENPSMIVLSWEQVAGGRLLYRLTAPSGVQDAFAEYAGPVSIAVTAAAGASIKGEAVVESPAGVRGPATTFGSALGRRLPPPAIKGTRDGAVSTKGVELRFTAPAEGEVRFEIATDGEFPPSVTAASPRVPDPLVIDAAEGQTLVARVAARTFDPSGAALPSSDTQISLTIDKTPPDPPVASGIADGGYYEEARRVTLLSAEGTIFYTLAQGRDAGIPGQTDENRFKGDLVLDSRAGQSVSYRIVAFTVDEAGNRSREIRSWSVTIDQKIVYVSPAGNDYADGSRGSPVRGLERALKIADSSSRKTVFVAAGSYTLDSQLALKGDITLVGGLDPESWTPLGLERWSTLTPAAPWRSGTALLAMTGGKVTIRGFEIADGAKILPSLVAVWDGELRLEKDSLRMTQKESTQGILIHAGAVHISACRLQAQGPRAGTLVSADGGALSAEGSEFLGPSGSTDFTCIALSDAKDVSLKGITVNPGTGQRTAGIRAVRSQCVISSSNLQSGAGTVEAIGMECRGSDVTIEDSNIDTTPRARTPTAVLSLESTLLVSRSHVTVTGSADAVGVTVRGGELLFSRGTIKGASTQEHLSLLRLEDARAAVMNSILTAGDAGESVCVMIKGGATDIVNDTIIAGTGAALTAAILVQGGGVPRVVNSIIVRGAVDRGSAICVMDARADLFARGSERPVMLTNSFSGWQTILHVDYRADLSIAAREIATAEALNDADENMFGGSMAGNVAEAPSRTFASAKAGDYRLRRDSACVDAGTDLADPNGPVGTGPILARKGVNCVKDLNEKPRPGSQQLAVPGPPRGWDMGAYQYSE